MALRLRRTDEFRAAPASKVVTRSERREQGSHHADPRHRPRRRTLLGRPDDVGPRRAAGRSTGDLFGWKAEEPGQEYGGYINFTKDGVRVAGCMARRPGPGMPDVWSVYLATDDAAARPSSWPPPTAVRSYVPAMPVGDLGTMAVVGDPGGRGDRRVAAGTAQGLRGLGEPGAPCWFELHTRDYEATVPSTATCSAGTPTSMSDTPEFRYTTLGDGEEPWPGSWTRRVPARGVPSHWSIYFGVETPTPPWARRSSSAARSSCLPRTRRTAASRPPPTTGAAFKLVAPNDAMPCHSTSG